MHVLLIRPHVALELSRRFNDFLLLEPLDLEIVAGGVDTPHTVAILDLSIERAPFRALETALRNRPPNIVGLGGYSNQIATVRRLADCVRKLAPEARIVAGGVHASLLPMDMNDPARFDFVIRGEGATALRRLLAALEKGETPADPAILPTGDPRYGELATGAPPPHPSYDEMPHPRRDLVDRSRYFCVWSGNPDEKVETLFPRMAAMRTSVGCPRRCSFCVVHFLANGKYIQRKPEDVVAEIEGIKEDFIYFVDDEMFINPARAEAIARLLLARGVRKQYVSWARSDTICSNPDLFRLWQQAGLEIVYVGLESFEEDALQDFNKGVTPEINRRAVEILRECGIVLHSAMIVNPDFTKEDFLRLHRDIDIIAPAEMSFTVLSPSPGTDYWRETCSRFISPDPYAFYDCMHTLLPTRLPLKTFYKYFALLYLHGFRRNPRRIRRGQVPMRDVAKLAMIGFRLWRTLHRLHKNYA